MSGSGRIPRIIKGTMFATFADNGSAQKHSNSIMLSQKELREYEQIDWITSGRPTVFVTNVKDHDTIFIPGWLPPQKVLPARENGRMCTVCEEHYVHKEKCTNKQLLLEGSNSRHSSS